MRSDDGRDLAAQQAGVITRRQLLERELSPRQARRRLDSGHWRTAFPGVWFTFTGPVGDEARAWAAVLYSGPGAALGDRAALWRWGARPDLPDPVDVLVPHERQVRPVPGIRSRRVKNLASRLHPARTPPTVRLEVAVLDLAERASGEEESIGIVLGTVQRRLTTADRLRTELAGRARHRRRALLSDLLAEAGAGVASPLERRYARNVERSHGLPTGLRNRAENYGPSTRYHDVRYPGFGVIVELDGLESHPRHEAFRDLRRDNEAMLHQDRVFRYGWRDVSGRPCQVAEQVGRALAAGGWRGRVSPCGPACSAG